MCGIFVMNFEGQLGSGIEDWLSIECVQKIMTNSAEVTNQRS